MMRRLFLAASFVLLLPAVAEAANCNSNPFTLANGQTADATQVMANFNNLLNCSNNSLAHNGANSDITSLSGLTTPLSVPQGGTGATSFASGGVLLGNGVSPVQLVAPSTSGNLLISNGSTWMSGAPALTAGNLLVSTGTSWASAPQPLNASFETGAVATGTTVMPGQVDTNPTNTQGDQYMALTVTPSNAASALDITVVWNGASTATSALQVALFQDSIATASALTTVSPVGANLMTELVLRHRMLAGTTSPTTFKVRAGSGGVGTTTFNGASGSRIGGGVTASSITVIESTP